jgi:uncharacterized membrane protein YdjX (TVP38/TMEM64 family)
MDKRIKRIIEVLVAVIVFLLFSYIIQYNLEYLEKLITNNLVGMLIYLSLEILSIVIAPVTTLPLIIIATNLWGWFLTGILNILGWFLGSWIAFLIARKYGIKIVKRFISIEKIHRIENKIPKERLFWSVVLLRMVVPADILSYAIGIFTRMSKKSYLLATLIGITPFAFIWAYFGGIKIKYQIILFLAIGILILIGWITKLICKRCVKFIVERKKLVSPKQLK